VAVQVVDSNRPFATTRSSGRTSDFRYAPAAAWNVMSAAATTTATTTSWANVSPSNANATGMLTRAANRVRSIAIITGRLRRNSTQGPSGNATTAPTASPTAASADTADGPACSTKIAISVNALNPSQVPNVLTAYAAQSHPNRRPSLTGKIEARRRQEIEQPPGWVHNHRLYGELLRASPKLEQLITKIVEVPQVTTRPLVAARGDESRSQPALLSPPRQRARRHPQLPRCLGGCQQIHDRTVRAETWPEQHQWL
jgi:hypothetical protein